MFEASSISLIEIVELLGLVIGVISVVYIARSFKRESRTNDARFIMEVFDTHETSMRWIIDNPKAVKILAERKEKTVDKLIKDFINSSDFRQIYRLYVLHELKLFQGKLWEHTVEDMKGLFAQVGMIERWNEIKTSLFPQDFQDFIQIEVIGVNKKQD